jgi:transcription initiation factor TFIIIB Brf1 subunit/transcription initiation factor TFIIB
MNSAIDHIFTQIGKTNAVVKNKVIEDDIYGFDEDEKSINIHDLQDCLYNINNRSVDESTYRKENIHKPVKCQECNLEMYKSSMEYICENCGKIEEITGGYLDVSENGSDSISDYNTSSNSAAPVRISGPNSHQYQKKFISSTSNYKKQQMKNTEEQITNIIHNYEGIKVPTNVVKDSAKFYYSVQQHTIKRGDVRIGTMAACTYRVCKKYGLIRKPKEISDMYGIDQNEFSNGEKILDELFAKGLLKDNSEYAVSNFYSEDEPRIDAFLGRYFEAMNIPDKYIKFTKILIKFTIKFKIANSSIISSKCAGAIYILSTRVPELEISKQDVANACQISKSTFTRFSKAVLNLLEMPSDDLDKSRKTIHMKLRSRLRNIFKKNNISLD